MMVRMRNKEAIKCQLSVEEECGGKKRELRVHLTKKQLPTKDLSLSKFYSISHHNSILV